MGMSAEEITEKFDIDTFADLAQHPSHGLVHQVMGMMQVYLRIPQAP